MCDGNQKRNLVSHALVFALKKGVDIIVGTPGRIKDLLVREILTLQDILYLVFDEVLLPLLLVSVRLNIRLTKC